MSAEEKYWFPAKRYGWGWGAPTRWQGWAVVALFLGLLAAGAFIFPPQFERASYIAYDLVLFALLIGVCWLKGEPPRWRWGKR